MTPRTSISFAALLGFSSALCAQQTKPPTLNQILERLDANLNHYDATVPSFFCDEHILSSRTAPGTRDDKAITDSVFRLKRTPTPNQTTTLVESRDIKSVDGKPATSQHMDGPSMLDGVFEGGLAVVSLAQTSCINYDLQRINKNRPGLPYIVRFSTLLTPRNTANCLLQEDTKGRALIDPASMQVTHLELNTPHHIIIPGSLYRSPVVGKRTLTVDYAPVQLSGETFWMPTAINQSIVDGDGTFHKTVWSFQATYRNYHKLEVTSRIVPANETPTP